MANDKKGTGKKPVIGISFSATTDGDLVSDLFEDSEDRTLTTGEILVLACYMRAARDEEWGFYMIDWFEKNYGDTFSSAEDSVEGVAV
jgi:hypothetical protein